MTIRASSWAVMGLFLCVAGCSSDPASSPGSAAPGAGNNTETGAGTEPAGSASASQPDGGPAANNEGVLVPSSGCGGASPPSGNVDWTIKSGGQDRVVRVHLPPGYSGKTPTPMVLAFHGRNSTPSQQELLSGMTAKADAAGFAVAYPTGIGQTWNAGLCCGQAQTDNIDDIAFTKALLDEMEAKLCVDKKRVFATGLSNGGFMSHRVACELADRVAAIGPVAGQLMMTSCKPSRPVPVMHFHGTSDSIVSYEGSYGLPGVEASLKAWATRNGCKGTATQTYSKGDTACSTYAQCTAGADVTLCTVQGGGHQWPGGIAIPGLGKTTKDINATDAMWTFFEAHPMP